MAKPDDSGGAARRRRARKRGQGELEARVLSVLRTAPGPVNAAWVQQRIGEDLAYTTVVTILGRLHEKEIVHRTRSGRAYVWSPAADEAGIAALRMRKVLDSEDDRDAVLASFVSSLSEQDERLMRDLLRDAERAGHTGSGASGDSGGADGRAGD